MNAETQLYHPELIQTLLFLTGVLPLLEVIVPCDNIPNVKERPNLAFNVGFAIERGCDDCIRVVAAIGMGLLVRLCNTSLIWWR